MQSVMSVNLHQFGSGLLVEVIGRGNDADVVVRSYELDVVDQGKSIVRPRAPLAAGEEALISDRLTADGYQMETTDRSIPTP